MRRRHVLLAAPLAAALAAVSVTVDPRGAVAGRPPVLLTAGLVRAADPDRVRGLAPADAVGARYLPGSNVLRRADGALVLGAGVPGPLAQLSVAVLDDAAGHARAATDAVARDRAWLAAGAVPGRTPTERALAERALLDLDLLVRPDGAVAAAEFGPWRYTWPRDASWVAAALAVTGHRDRALTVLEHLGRLQGPDGTWEARYHIGGSPVDDGRAAQLDATGWVPWAVWMWVRSAAAYDAEPDAAALDRLWPTVQAAADAAAGSLDSRGLPRATPDYWETPVSDVTVATVGPLRAGLRAAADLAGLVGDRAADAADAADRWRDAARRLDAGVGAHFAATGFRRTPDRASGADAGVAFLAPPFAPYDEAVDAAVRDAERRLRTPSGGLRPGERWRADPSIGWTPATGFALLAAATSGRRGDADRWLAWFAAHRTAVGALPEKVDAQGHPVSVAPLAWTDAIVLLSLVARDSGLPIPPVP